MKARGRFVFIGCALSALLTLTAVAEAKPGYFVKPKHLQLKLTLPASDGYSASLSTNGHRQVTLTVSKGDFVGHYLALGRVTRKGIEADFDSFGRVSLRFRSESRFHPRLLPGLKLPPFLRDHCKGRKSVGERGIFRGNVRFTAEHEFTQVRAHRLKGSVVRSYRRVCKGRSLATASNVKPSDEGTVLQALAQRDGKLRLLIMTELSLVEGGKKESLTTAIGGLKEKVGRVAVSKALIFLDLVDSVEISPEGEKPLSAEVVLPKPFEGTGSYLQEGKAPPVWSGSLSARLPGSGLVPLTGPEFKADLCHSTDFIMLKACLERLLSDDQLAQGSGSHSHPLAEARLSSLR
ncbi:MAG TPA: hypothetical protein VFP21_00125 [Solirubrobacterales bacterium]|nr:hypothetical protein [Solirubrobacterales bacterium]